MEKKRKVSRTFPSYSAPKPVPYIRLSGTWLEQAGFRIGDEYAVETNWNGEIRLVRSGNGREIVR